MSDSENSLEARLLEALATVQEPSAGQDLVSAGLVREMTVQGGRLRCRLSLLVPDEDYRQSLEAQVRQALQRLRQVSQIGVDFELRVPDDGRPRGQPIRNAIAVASGKGGVGKTTVAVNLAVALAQGGARVGLLDADVYGPNVPIMLGVDKMPPPQEGKMVPAEAFGVRLVSIAFMVPPGQPLIWRGPMLHSAIRQFVTDVRWGEMDYLIVDLPPGTGDAPLSVAQTLPLSGAVIVTLPQQVSLADARRGLGMFRAMDVPVFGVVENMSFLQLPDGSRMDVFGEGGGRTLAEEAGVVFLGAIPMDPVVRQASDSGVPVVISHPDSPVAQAFRKVAREVATRVAAAALQQGAPIPIEIED